MTPTLHHRFVKYKTAQWFDASCLLTWTFCTRLLWALSTYSKCSVSILIEQTPYVGLKPRHKKMKICIHLKVVYHISKTTLNILQDVTDTTYQNCFWNFFCNTHTHAQQIQIPCDAYGTVWTFVRAKLRITSAGTFRFQHLSWVTNEWMWDHKAGHGTPGETPSDPVIILYVTWPPAVSFHTCCPNKCPLIGFFHESHKFRSRTRSVRERRRIKGSNVCVAVLIKCANEKPKSMFSYISKKKFYVK